MGAANLLSKRIFRYFSEALEALGSRPDITDIDLLPSGDYAAVESRSTPVFEEVPDDGSPYVPEPVEPKREPVDASDEPSGSAGGVAASGTTSAEPVVVVVVVTADDEEPMVSALYRHSS